MSFLINELNKRRYTHHPLSFRRVGRPASFGRIHLTHPVGVAISRVKGPTLLISLNDNDLPYNSKFIGYALGMYG